MPRLAASGATTAAVSLVLAAAAAAQEPAVATPSGSDSLARDRLGGAVHRVVHGDSLGAVAPRTLSELLATRVPGAYVLRRSGYAGVGADVRIRGRRSVLNPGGPLVYVDGLRVDARLESGALVDADGAPSRLDDVAVGEIERVEVLPGAASAWAYGAGAENGVVLITTRDGGAGPLRWRARSEQGTTGDIASHEPNHGGWWTNNGTPQPGCTRADVAAGACTLDSLTAFSPLAERSPFRAGFVSRLGLEGSGRTRIGHAQVSLARSDEGGVYHASDHERTSLRGSLAGRPREGLAARAHLAHVAGRTRLPVAAGSMSILTVGLLGNVVDDEYDGYYLPLDWFAGRDNRQHLTRTAGGVGLEWTAREWLLVTADLGADRADVADRLREDYPATAISSEWHGWESADARLTTHTWRLGARARYEALGLSHRSTLTFERLREQGRGRHESGTFWNGEPTVTQESARWFDDRSLGVTLRQDATWGDRLAVSLGLRSQEIDTWVSKERLLGRLYPGASVAWRVARQGLVGDLELRAAYGEVGSPVLRSAVAFGVGAPSIVLGPASGGSVRPERTRETEIGARVALLHGRLDAGVTWYDQRTRHVTDRAPAPPSTGGGTVLLDGARVRNAGLELTLDARLVDRPGLTWTAGLLGATNQNTLVSGGLLPIARLEGRSLDARGYRRVTSASDLDGDGVLGYEEVQVDAGLDFGGSAHPTREGALHTRLSVHGVSLAATLGYLGGFEQVNATAYYRCTMELCSEAHDPRAGLAEQRRYIASAHDSFEPFVEDGSIVRLSEIALTIGLPARLAGSLGARSAALSMAGRNLARWTDYSGPDPEVRGAYIGSTFGVRPGDYFVQPHPREIVARLEIGW